jgi:hypothetical protein
MAFGSGEGREMKSGAKREVEQGPTALDRNPEFRKHWKVGIW